SANHVQIGRSALRSHWRGPSCIKGNGGQKINGVLLYWELKPRRHHAHDTEGVTIQGQILTNDFLTCCKTALPKTMAQDNRRVGGRLVFTGKKSPSQRRSNTQHGKQICRRDRAGQMYGLASSCKSEISLVKCGHALEGTGTRSPVQKGWIRDVNVIVPAGLRGLDGHQAARVMKGKRTQ